MTKSMTAAYQAPHTFRERVQAIRAKMDAAEIGPALAMLEIGVAYLNLEQTLAWALETSHSNPLLLKSQAKLRQLARAIVDVPDFGPH